MSIYPLLLLSVTKSSLNACCILPYSGFSNISNLKEHKKTHTTDREFTCDQCGKSFNMHRKLLKHKIRHSGEKPHTCQTCGAYQPVLGQTLRLSEYGYCIL